MEIDLAQASVLLLVSVLAAIFGALVIAALHNLTNRSGDMIFSESHGGTTFLFDGETLIDATPEARALLTQLGLAGNAWNRLLAYLAPRFPEFEGKLPRLQVEGRLTLAAQREGASALILRAEARGGLTRITLLDAEDRSETSGQDLLAQQAVLEELAQLRFAMTQLPSMIWRQNAAGGVVWANAAYLTQVMARLEPGRDLDWPLPRLFAASADQAATAVTQRLRLAHAAGGESWFDVTTTEAPDGQLCIGQPVDSLVQAENALRDFTQTLTKTFAHLPIGLAVFDRQRHLALFNPALLDLSGLPPDFLSMKPTLFAFLDKMRDRNMIPEPKDYRSWRKQMTDLEQAASSGLFEETWALPTGQTYRVIGRPHPNGALAIMFEDISSEVSRMRRYRADLELSQSVVDAVDQAIAVFSPAGLLVMTNAAYNELWGHEPADTLATGSIGALCAHWRSRCGPTTIWAEGERFATDPEDRAAITGEVRLLDGRLLECSFSGLIGGSTLARFKLVSGNVTPALRRA